MVVKMKIPSVKFSADGRRARLLEPFDVRVAGHRIHVPAHFRTDFASVPRFLWPLFPPWGPSWRAAVVHDYLYQMRELTRREADRVFLHLCLRCGVPRGLAVAAYLALRACGWTHW
jgi:hypothetical protein